MKNIEASIIIQAYLAKKIVTDKAEPIPSAGRINARREKHAGHFPSKAPPVPPINPILVFPTVQQAGVIDLL